MGWVVTTVEQRAWLGIWLTLLAGCEFVISHFKMGLILNPVALRVCKIDTNLSIQKSILKDLLILHGYYCDTVVNLKRLIWYHGLNLAND